MTRKIIHVDMDAFYASVEQRDNPALRGRPVIVGGAPDRRGVVAACSYEARKYGIHSAMPSSRAIRLCPHAVFVPVRFQVYRETSRRIQDIFFLYTDLVEPLSLDEAYLDVTENKKSIPSATEVARLIREDIKKATGLTASAGVSFNKFLAKIASNLNKPDGMAVITPDKAAAFLDRLPIGKFHGIGKATEKKMIEMGIHTGADLKAAGKERLIKRFGKLGAHYYEMAWGRDDRPVRPDRIRKSLGKETTLHRDIDDRTGMLRILGDLATELEDSLKKRKLAGRTVTLKVRYADFTLITRSITLGKNVCRAEEIMEQAPSLLDKTEAGKRKVRLLGITVSGFQQEEERTCVQLALPFGQNQ